MVKMGLSAFFVIKSVPMILKEKYHRWMKTFANTSMLCARENIKAVKTV